MEKYTVCFSIFTNYTEWKPLFAIKNKCSLFKIHNHKRAQKPPENTVENVEKIKFTKIGLTKNFTVFFKYGNLILVIE